MEILNLILKALHYNFIQKALVSGLFISGATSLLGNFLVLRRHSLISDGLSHVTFATVSISLFLGLSPLSFSIPLVIFSSILINKLSEKSNIYSDAAIGLVSSISMAIGVICISVSKGFNIDIYSYLFGNILAITIIELILSIFVSFIVIILIILFFNDLFLITYDEEYAKISKVRIKLINTILAIIQSITIVVGIKLVGALLISALIIFPTISSLQLASNFKKMILISLIISICSMTFGIFLSFILNFPTGATIVIINGLIFVFLFSFKKLNKSFM